MKSVSFTDFRANASALLDEVEQGETVIVLRHGKAVAEIHPAAPHAKRLPSWKRPGPRLTTKGEGLSTAILGERGREDVF